MKTLISILFIASLIMCACGDTVTGSKFDFDNKPTPDIRLEADGKQGIYFAHKVYSIPAYAKTVTISFTGSSDADTTSYVATLDISLDSTVQTALIGSSYITGCHSYTYIVDGATAIRLYASLFCDKFGLPGGCTVGAFLHITGIKVQFNKHNASLK